MVAIYKSQSLYMDGPKRAVFRVCVFFFVDVVVAVCHMDTLEKSALAK